jgi:hypothetical protein
MGLPMLISLKVLSNLMANPKSAILALPEPSRNILAGLKSL